MTDLNPQARQMADESMVRGLDAQARAIWPQEVPLLRRYALPADASILDAGCGTGEGSSRLAALFPAPGYSESTSSISTSTSGDHATPAWPRGCYSSTRACMS
jgi:hypothetical protein